MKCPIMVEKMWYLGFERWRSYGFSKGGNVSTGIDAVWECPMKTTHSREAFGWMQNLCFDESKDILPFSLFHVNAHIHAQPTLQDSYMHSIRYLQEICIRTFSDRSLITAQRLIGNGFLYQNIF